MPTRPTIRSQAEELLRRGLADEPEAFDVRRVTPEPTTRATTVDPETAATLAAVADAVSTYSFLHRGTAVEGNGLLKPFNNHPLATAAGVAGSAVAMRAVRALLRKAGHDKIADTLAGVQGGHQLGIAALNLQHDYSGGAKGSERQMIAKVLEEVRRK